MKIETFSPTIRRKEMDAVLAAMVEDKIGPGDRSKLLIQTAKEHLCFDYALALRSPAVALHTALKALKAKPGQAVIVSVLSPHYYLQVIADLQMLPLFCDVSYDFPCMSRAGIESLLSSKPADIEICACVFHHTLGFAGDTASIAELGIPLIEDISQSAGSCFFSDDKTAEDRGKSGAPVNGLFCILGLEERDLLTSGGGALLFSMNRKDGLLLKDFSYLPDEYCLPDINAAMAVIQFKEAKRNLNRRNEIIKTYVNASLRTRHKRFAAHESGNYYSFPLVLETGLKDVIAYARKKDILLENAFEKSVAALKNCENCPAGNSLAMRTVLFPVYPLLRSADIENVSRLIMTLP